MPKPLLTRVFLRAFRLGLVTNAALTRSPLRFIESRLLTPVYARLTLLIRGRREVGASAKALGEEWERLLASRKTAHLTTIEPEGEGRPETAWGEITVHCPLRGTGDTAACHRLMAYDRALMKAVGGQLVVVESQAEPGRTVCRVAIRRAGAPP